MQWFLYVSRLDFDCNSIYVRTYLPIFIFQRKIVLFVMYTFYVYFFTIKCKEEDE